MIEQIPLMLRFIAAGAYEAGGLVTLKPTQPNYKSLFQKFVVKKFF